MKKKKIKSLAKQIFKLGREYDRKGYSEEVTLKEESLGMGDLGYCEYDENVSKKFSKFVLNLIKVKYKISIDLYAAGCSVFCDLNKFKSSKNYTENTFDIKIDKTGFKIRRNYSNWTAYKDPNIFDSLKEQFVEKNKKLS